MENNILTQEEINYIKNIDTDKYEVLENGVRFYLDNFFLFH